MKKKETRCAHICKLSIPAGEAIIIPHYSHGNTLPLYRSPFWDELLPSQTTRNKELVFSTSISLFFRDCLITQPSPWIGDYACASSRPSQEKLQVPTSSVVKAVIRWKKPFSSPTTLGFFERYQIHSELVPMLTGCLLRFRAPEKLTLCFHAANELEDLTLTDQTCHFHILDQAHTAGDTSYLFYLQWQFSQPIESVTTSIKIFFSPF